jgi:hypothetical protein
MLGSSAVGIKQWHPFLEVPHARGHDPGGGSDPRHLARSPQWIIEELNHKLGENRVEGTVLERQSLGRAEPHVGARNPPDTRRDVPL